MAEKNLLAYIQHYGQSTIDRVIEMQTNNQLGAYLQQKYDHTAHAIQNDRALADYTQQIQQQFMRKTQRLHQIYYDAHLDTLKHALGMHMTQSRVHGGKLKSTQSIIIAGLFKQAPEAFLQTIVVHELAHLREREHDKAFYRLCLHMLPDYHQREFDLRLWLLHRASVTQDAPAS